MEKKELVEARQSLDYGTVNSGTGVQPGISNPACILFVARLRPSAPTAFTVLCSIIVYSMYSVEVIVVVLLRVEFLAEAELGFHASRATSNVSLAWSRLSRAQPGRLDDVLTLE